MSDAAARVLGFNDLTMHNIEEISTGRIRNVPFPILIDEALRLCIETNRHNDALRLVTREAAFRQQEYGPLSEALLDAFSSADMLVPLLHELPNPQTGQFYEDSTLTAVSRYVHIPEGFEKTLSLPRIQTRTYTGAERLMPVDGRELLLVQKRNRQTDESVLTVVPGYVRERHYIKTGKEMNGFPVSKIAPIITPKDRLQVRKVIEDDGALDGELYFWPQSFDRFPPVLETPYGI